MIGSRKIKAVYTNGQLRLLEDAELKEGQEVIVELPTPARTQEERDAAYQEFLGSLTHEEAEEIRKFVEENFEQIDEELWK